MLVTPTSAPLPSGGPDTLLSLTPPGAVSLLTGFELTVSVSAGAAQVTPYFWANGKWYPLGDNVNAPKLVSVDAAGVADGCGRFVAPAIPRFWAFLKTGMGTISTCGVEQGDYS